MKFTITCIGIALFLILNFPLSAQTSCGTLHETDAIVEDLVLKNKMSLKRNDSKISIPIQFHVTRGDDGISDFEPRFVDSILVVLNDGFADTPFDFYKCSGINYIDDDDYETLYYYSASAGQDMEGFHSFYNSKKAINVYLANSTSSVGSSAWAQFPWSDNHSYIIAYSQYRSNTHVHEMGHLLGLLHTHTGYELVDGSNCETSGDLCCDTPAETSLGSVVNSNCEYIGTEQDAFGQYYEPDVGNFMSYAPQGCRKFFTQDQSDRMVYFYSYYMKKFQCDDDFEYTDISFDYITTEPYPAVEGEPYKVVVKVSNGGNTKASSFKVDLLRDDERIGRRSSLSIFPTNPAVITYPDREEFPHEAGRYLLCVEADGDSLEINTLDNHLCQEILVRQKYGIPDISIGNLSHPAAIGELTDLNPISFNLENLGNIKAEGITGKVFVNDGFASNFSLADIDVAENVNVEILAPFNREGSNEVCITLDPAFTEERLDNNNSCASFVTFKSHTVDIEIDSVYIFPNDSLLFPETSYKLYYLYKNNGPNIAWKNSSYLDIGGELKDSIIYSENLGWPEGYSKIDSFDLVVPNDVTHLDICVEINTYKDTMPENNTLCLSRSVDGVSSVEKIDDLVSVTLYPNPVSQILTIESRSIVNCMSIFNNLGSLVISFEKIKTTSKTVNFVDFRAGIYHLVIETENGRINRTVTKY